jgi:hypothetical protein
LLVDAVITVEYSRGLAVSAVDIGIGIEEVE